MCVHGLTHMLHGRPFLGCTQLTGPLLCWVHISTLHACCTPALPAAPGDYDSRVRAGHPVFVMNMAMQQEQDVFFVYGSGGWVGWHAGRMLPQLGVEQIHQSAASAHPRTLARGQQSGQHHSIDGREPGSLCVCLLPNSPGAATTPVSNSPALRAVLPLDLPAVRAILAEAQTGHGKMLCAQWVRVQGAGAGRGEALQGSVCLLMYVWLLPAGQNGSCREGHLATSCVTCLAPAPYVPQRCLKRSCPRCFRTARQRHLHRPVAPHTRRCWCLKTRIGACRSATGRLRGKWGRCTGWHHR